MKSHRRVKLAALIASTVLASVGIHQLIYHFVHERTLQTSQRRRDLERGEFDTQLENLRSGANTIVFSPYTGQGVDAKIGEIVSLTQIQVAVFDRVDLTGTGLGKLEALPKLRCLVIIQCDIGDNGLSALKEKSSIRQLVLANTGITALSLPTIGSLTGLTHLVLFDDSMSEAALHVTDGDVAELTRCRSLKTLAVGGTWATLVDRGVIADLQLRHPVSLTILDVPPSADGAWQEYPDELQTP